MSERVIFSHEPIFAVDAAEIAALKARAATQPDGHARLCLHHDARATVHQMIIVHRRGAYVRPHRHADKPESFQIIEGALRVVIFDDDGGVAREIAIEATTPICRIDPGTWHSVVPTAEVAVFHEITAGPFTGAGDSEFPAWAPEKDDAAGIAAFRERIDG